MAQPEALAQATRNFVEADRAYAEARARAKRAEAAAQRVAIRHDSYRVARIPA